MKVLNGKELAEFIKNRHVNETSQLLNRYKLTPKLAIVVLVDNPIIDIYIKLKQNYGQDIGVMVEVHRVTIDASYELIENLNNDPSVHGIIIQLPISDITKTDEIVDLVSPSKDVDALGKNAIYDPATPKAILWLLAGYNVNLTNKNILLIGKGKLVGKPLEKMLLNSNLTVKVADKNTTDIKKISLVSDIIITATGQPRILTSDMLKLNSVIVDAGVASESGKTVGDLDPGVYDRSDLTLTPAKGGVGPLTVCALFENLLIATKNTINK